MRLHREVQTDLAHPRYGETSWREEKTQTRSELGK